MTDRKGTTIPATATMLGVLIALWGFNLMGVGLGCDGQIEFRYLMPYCEGVTR